MISLPTVQRDILFNQLFPDLPISQENVYKMIEFLYSGKSTTPIIPMVIKGVNSIIKNTGSGEVVVHVRGERASVEINEPIGNISLK